MMIASDQHAVLGRLMFENKEAAARLAINHEKAKQMWRDMSAAAKAMEWELNATDPCENIRKNFPSPAQFEEFEKKIYPAKEQIIEVLKEIRNATQEVAEYQARIKSILPDS